LKTCERISVLLHRRSELEGAQQLALQRHLEACGRCREVLIEIERVEDLLGSWEVPEPDDGFTASVLSVLAGEGPEASCEETAAEIHHLIAGDLEPWRVGPIEAHLGRCLGCADTHRSAADSRERWLEWSAPEPPRSFADRVLARLRAVGRDARSAVPTRDPSRARPWLLGELRIPRLAAALVVVAASLALGELFLDASRPGPSAVESVRESDANGPVTAASPRRAPTQMMLQLYGSRPGRFDIGDSFSTRIPPARGSLLRDART
jgi:anti-sigma factor RsiW